jgi:cytochrome c biogenesis protein CcdA
MGLEGIIEFHKRNMGMVFGITMVLIIVALVLIGLGGLKKHNKSMLIGATIILSLLGLHQMFMATAIGGSKAVASINQFTGDQVRGRTARLQSPPPLPTDSPPPLPNATPAPPNFEESG